MRAYEEETEFAPEAGEADYGEAEYGEYEDAEFDEFEDGEDGESGADEFEGEFEEEFADEMDHFLAELQELTGEYGSPLSEEEELELAEALLETSTEEELDHFLGGLVAKAVGRLVTSPAARRIVGAAGTGLRRLLRRAPKVEVGRYRPFVARVDRQRVAAERRKHDKPRQQRRREQLTAWNPQHADWRARERDRLQGQSALDRRAGYRRMRRVENSQWRDYRRMGEHPAKRFARKGAPWFGWGVPAGVAGSAIYSGAAGPVLHKVGDVAGNVWQTLQGIWPGEFEGMSLEEAEFEAARRFVRLSAAAARNLAAARRGARPRRVARAALLAASRRYAPGIYRRFPLYVAPTTGYLDRGPQEPPEEPGMFSDEPYSDPDDPGQVPEEPAGSNGRPARRPASGRWTRRGNRIIITGL